MKQGKVIISILLGVVLLSLVVAKSTQNQSKENSQKSQKTLKNSVPFSQVQKRAIELMGEEYAKKINNELLFLTLSKQEDIVQFFSNKNYNGNQQEYWFKYYLLTEIVLFAKTDWKLPQMQEIEDHHYKNLVNKDQEYLQKLNNCKAQSNKFISLGADAKYNLGDDGTLYNLDYSYETLELIEKDKYFQYIYHSLPKGIIHHIHWSAAFNYIAFYESIAESLKNEPDNGEKRIVVSAQVYLEDVTVGKVKTEKYMTKFFITKQKYVDPSNQVQVVKDNQATINSFIENVTQEGNCLNYLKNDSGFNPADADFYLRGYIYWKYCSGVLFDDKLSQQGGSAKPFGVLKQALKYTVAVFEQDELAIKELPLTYIQDNIHEDKSVKEILGIWYNFEQVFQGLSEFTDQKDIFSNLTNLLFKQLKDQNTQGIEFRNKNDAFQVSAFDSSSKLYQIPYSFITPGRKVSGKGSKGSAIVLKAKTIKDPHFVGIDFFAFEDDPYNGARNFFTLAFTSIIENNSTYFDMMFKYLDLENGSMYLHAGETDFFYQDYVTREFADENYINDNIFHAVLLPGIKRLGHGFDSVKDGLLLGIIQAKNISLETCPISNQILNFNEIYTNPTLTLLRSGVHLSISPDDPGLFGYVGVSHDWFYMIMLTDIKPSEIYLLLKYSIEHSSIQEVIANREQYLHNLHRDLNKFYQGLDNVYSDSQQQQQEQSQPQPTLAAQRKMSAHKKLRKAQNN